MRRPWGLPGPTSVPPSVPQGPMRVPPCSHERPVGVVPGAPLRAASEALGCPRPPGPAPLRYALGETVSAGAGLADVAAPPRAPPGPSPHGDLMAHPARSRPRQHPGWGHPAAPPDAAPAGCGCHRVPGLVASVLGARPVEPAPVEQLPGPAPPTWPPGRTLSQKSGRAGPSLCGALLNPSASKPSVRRPAAAAVCPAWYFASLRTALRLSSCPAWTCWRARAYLGRCGTPGHGLPTSSLHLKQCRPQSKQTYRPSSLE